MYYACKRPIWMCVILFLVLCTGCGNNTSAYSLTGDAASTIEKAVNIADQFLDGDLDYAEASDKLDRLKDKMEYISGEEKGTDAKLACSSLAGLSATLYTYNLEKSIGKDTTDSYNSIIDARNRLAAMIGEKEL